MKRTPGLSEAQQTDLVLAVVLGGLLLLALLAEVA
jgi:hypothetical protein